MDEAKLKKKTFGVFNPNQRQFFEDELRYREKLQQLHAGLENESQSTNIISTQNFKITFSFHPI